MKEYWTSKWESERLAVLFAENKSKNAELSSVNALQFRFGSIVPKRQFELTPDLKDTYSKYTLVEPNDIMINGLNLNYDFVTQRIARVEEEGIITSAYVSLRPREGVCVPFYNYYLKALDSQKVFNGLGTGIRLTLSYDTIKNLELPVPPRPEQDQIVRYLDWQVSKINRLIAAKRKQIVKIEEHREAMINHAVTAGIDRVELIGSNVNWLPMIPQNWKIVPAKALFTKSIEQTHPGDTMLAATQKYGMISQVEYMQREGRRIVLANDSLDKWQHVEPDDFIISLRSFQGGLEICTTPGCVTWHYVVLKPNEKVYPGYFRWLFKSASYIAALQKTSDFIRDGQDLRFSNFVKVPLMQISLDEQKRIAEYLDTRVPKYEQLIEKLKDEIGRLKEFETRLISDVVTGQIDVRGIEIPDFDFTPDTEETDEMDAGEMETEDEEV